MTPLPTTVTQPPIQIPSPTMTPEPVAQNIVAGPTAEPTPTPEPLLESDCQESVQTSEFVIPTDADGTTKRVEPLPGVVFQDTRKHKIDNYEEKRAWVFRELSYQHCKTDDPWNPEYFVVEGQEIDAPPRKEGDFVQMVFSLGLHQRNANRDIVQGDSAYSSFAAHPELRRHPPSFWSTFYLIDEDAILYLWTNTWVLCSSSSCNITSDGLKKNTTDEWRWQPVSSARQSDDIRPYKDYQKNAWVLPLLPSHVPGVFAVVTNN